MSAVGAMKASVSVAAIRRGKLCVFKIVVLLKISLERIHDGDPFMGRVAPAASTIANARGIKKFRFRNRLYSSGLDV